MSSRESEHSQWRRYGNRDTRQVDDTDHRWRDRGRRDGDMSRDSYHRYGGEAHSSVKRGRGSWGRDDKPESSYSREPYDRDWRRSPDRRNNYFKVTPDKDTALERQYTKLREDDQELLRKRKELEEIEDQIAYKKAFVEKCIPAKSKRSPERSISEKKQWKVTEDLEDFKYRLPPEDFTHRWSPHGRHRQRSDDYTYRQPQKEFKHRTTEEDDDFKYRPSHKEFKQRPMDEADSKYRPPHKDFKHRPSEEHFKYRQPSREYKSRHTDDDFEYSEFKKRLPEDDSQYRKTSRYSEDRQRSDSLTYRHTPEYQQGEPFKSSNDDNLKDQSHDFLLKLTTKPREKSEYHYLQSEDFHQNRRAGLVNEVRRHSDGQVSETEQGVTQRRADEQNTADKGFQRFLNVLNKGVDMSRLANIVCRTPAEEDSGTLKQDHVNYATGDGKPGLSSEKGSPVGFRGHTQFNENNFPKNNVGSSDFSSSSRSRSPLVAEKTQVKPEDEQKCRQMQGVLQAIGMDLGLEELGLMSHRIQERLYGKRDSEKKESDKDREKEVRRVYTPRHHSRSSSSDSSGFNQVSPPFPLKEDSKETQRVIHDPKDTTQDMVVTERGMQDPKDTTQTLNHHYTDDRDTIVPAQNTDQGKNMPQQSTFSPYPTYGPPPYSMPQCQAAPVMPPYPVGLYPPCTWPVPNPAFAPTWGMNVGPMPLLPRPPVFPPGPSVPPLNTYLSTSSQRTTNHQPTTGRQLTYVTLQDNAPVQPSNSGQVQNAALPVNSGQGQNPVQNPVQPVSIIQNQNPARLVTPSQTLTRPRCLQVIQRDKPQQTTKVAEDIEKEKKINSVQPKRTSMTAKIKNMSDLRYRRWLFYSGRLKAIHQRQQKQAQFNSTTEKSIVNLIQLARLKAASKSTAKGHGKVLVDNKTKSTIKLRLLVDEVIVKPSGSTECPEMPCEPDNTTQTRNVDG